jgi:uncharacterized membrane-anchored protein
MKTPTIAAVALLATSINAAAQGPASTATAEEFEAKLGYQTGTVTLKNGLATIRVPEAFRFIGPEGSRRLLVQGWSNPPESAAGVLGMLVPKDASPLSDDGWGIIITYEDDGYVSDDGATSIDYTKLLKEMQQQAEAVNEERQKDGYPPVTVVGWAETPHYDSKTHKLYWAKELAFGDEPEHTLNYSIRILGRRGVLVLNAVANMDHLTPIHEQSESVLAAVEFNEGHRYADYLPGTDKAAAYGLTGLIVGAGAAKAGLLKGLWLGLLAFKKALVAGVVALGAALKKMLGGNREQTTEQA